MKFFIKYLSSKCDQICSKLRIWSHLLEKYLMENFIFCAVLRPLGSTKIYFNDKLELIFYQNDFLVICSATARILGYLFHNIACFHTSSY